jgi:hypothetical protein
VNRVARLDPSRRAELFRETADRMGLSEAVVEKDFWVCWTLKQIFTIEQFKERLLFKGGTSLSKVFGAIQRFSEDIDLAVDYTLLGFVGDRDPTQSGLSRTRQLKLQAEMLAACANYIKTDFLEILQRRFTEILNLEGWTVSIAPEDPHVVRFRYPRSVQSELAYVSPQVILELGTHAEFIPRDHFPIRSFAAAEFPNVFEEPEVGVTALLARRTFWEKVTILHAEYYRAGDKELPGRYSRHYYDVAMMTQGPVRVEALADRALLAQVVRHKQAFYPAAWAHYELAVPGNLRVVPPEYRLAALRQDYRDMAAMIFGQAPTFDELLRYLAELEAAINQSPKRE